MDLRVERQVGVPKPVERTLNAERERERDDEERAADLTEKTTPA